MPSDLECAVQTGDREAVVRLAQEYGATVREEIRMAKNYAERERIFRDALETFHRALCLARILRSHLALQLQAATGQVAYQSSPRAQHTWRIEG